MVGRLQKGESVTLEDGRVVHPEQVTDVHVTDGRPFLGRSFCVRTVVVFRISALREQGCLGLFKL